MKYLREHRREFCNTYMTWRGKATCRSFSLKIDFRLYRNINSRRIPWLFELLIDYEIRIDHIKKTHGCNKSHDRMNHVDIIFIHLYFSISLILSFSHVMTLNVQKRRNSLKAASRVTVQKDQHDPGIHARHFSPPQKNLGRRRQ